MNNNNLPYVLTDFKDEIEVWEESVLNIDRELLDTLLLDRTSRKNIIWATDEYANNGPGYEFASEITPELLFGRYDKLVQPRMIKSQSERIDRTKRNAEVYTPSWLCNKQNNQIDEQWFRRKNVFNTESEKKWKSENGPISFEGAQGNWQDYVDAKRIEVTCGEAPYLVSRYDTVTGERIPLEERVGLLDRKMRIVQENATTVEDWLEWSQRAFESIYAYEYQGDSLLLARKNLLYSYIDYYINRFQQHPSLELLKKIALIISWNIWQMDGTKCVIPGSCKPVESYQLSLFDFIDAEGYTSEDEDLMCPGCKTDNILLHTGTYCKIRDWRSKTTNTYLSILEGGCDHDRL